MININGALAKEKSKKTKKNLPQCHIIYGKSHMDYPGIHTGPLH
jgi:hypothetical protein